MDISTKVYKVQDELEYHLMKVNDLKNKLLKIMEELKTTDDKKCNNCEEKNCYTIDEDMRLCKECLLNPLRFIDKNTLEELSSSEEEEDEENTILL